jgi:hypothetical protein
LRVVPRQKEEAMTVLRLFSIVVIFAVAAVAWMVLGGSVEFRTDNSDGSLGERVEGLWGGPQVQTAPKFTYRPSGDGAAKPLTIAATDITADFALKQRKKGLLWYATYDVDFDARYRLANPASKPAPAEMDFAFPASDGEYDGFAVEVNGHEVPTTYDQGIARATFELPANGAAEVHVGYATKGLDEWRYVPSPDGVGVVRDFALIMTTNFTEVDYPLDGVSPDDPVPTDTGMRLAWTYDSLVSGRPIGLVMPKPENPGPLAARISFFAPVSLLFYFAALVLLTSTSGVRLHPMNYGFLAAGFFAFHLLLAYLADHVDIYLAFAIASAVSVAPCVGYLMLVIGKGTALREIAASQFIFLVLFSYSFFFEGFTGLAVTVGSVLTLAYFMAKTGHVDWDGVFARTKARAVPAMATANGLPDPPPIFPG